MVSTVNYRLSDHKRACRRASRKSRRGTVVVLAAFLMVVMVAMLAFSVDYGYLLKVKTDMQRCADHAALAAVQDLVPDADGSQDLNAVRAALRTYVLSNLDSSFQVADADIEIGRFNPSTVYSNVQLLNSGIYDTVRVTLRRDGSTNSQVPLFFAAVIGVNQSPMVVTATAVLQKAASLEPGADVLPFTVPKTLWDSLSDNEDFTVYGDGKVRDSSGNEVPGNWGTTDIGNSNNSTSDLRDQILNGLRQSDLNSLASDGRIPTNTHIDGSLPAWLNGDPGLSSGMKSAVQAIHGERRIVPIVDSNNGAGGNNLEYHIVEWGVVEVVDSNWNGANNTSVTVKKSYMYDGDLRPQNDASNITDVIDGAYTSPALFE